jgi:perosamine synthetase
MQAVYEGGKKSTWFDPGAERIPFRVGILCEESPALLNHLQNEGVEPRTFFYPLHKQPAFSYLTEAYRKRGLCMDDKAYPNSVFGFNHGICLPTFPTLSEDDIDYVCNSIRKFFV